MQNRKKKNPLSNNKTNIKYLTMNLRNVQDLYEENFKTLLNNKTKKLRNKINLFLKKKTHYKDVSPDLSSNSIQFQLQTIPIANNSNRIFFEFDKIILKPMWKINM